MEYVAIHDFSLWLGTGSNPADINWCLSHTGNNIIFVFCGGGVSLFSDP